MGLAKTAVLLLFALSVTAVASAARADFDTARVIKAYGGSEAVGKARTVYAKGTIKAFMRGDDGSYERYMKRDGRLRVETKYSRSSELRVLNGKRGWRNMNDFPLEEVQGPPFLAMLYQYKEVDILYGLMKGLYMTREEGTAKVGAADCYLLDLEDADKIPMKVYVDRKSYRILRTEGYFSMGGQITSLASEYGDFRKVDGLLMPYKITNYAAGQKISETRIKEYRINMDMPEKLFMP